MFCFSLVAPGSYEVSIVAKQLHLQAGVFACDGHLVVSNLTSDRLFAKANISLFNLSFINMSTISGDIWAPAARGPHGHKHVQNAPAFKNAWDAVFRDGNYRDFDWTLKLDVDAVVLPDRVRTLLSWHQRDQHGSFAPLYLENTASDSLGNFLHGPIEALSFGAMQLYGKGRDHCVNQAGSNKWGEDFYLDKCLKLLKVPAFRELRLLKDAYMWGQRYIDCNTQEAVFHPLKSVDDYVRCLQQVGQPTIAVNFFAMNQLPTPAGALATKKGAALVISYFVAPFSLLVVMVVLGKRRFARRESDDSFVMRLEEASFLGLGAAAP